MSVASRPQAPARPTIASWHVVGSLACQLPCDAVGLSGAAVLAAAMHAGVTVTQLLPMRFENVDAATLSTDPSIAERHERVRAGARRQVDEIRRHLAQRGAAGEIVTLETIAEEPPRLAAAAARRADVTVMARPSDSVSDAGYAHSLFAGMLLGSGRPVLVVPEGALLEWPIASAVVAWTESPEASRAVHDALPLLARASHVHIVTIDAAPPPATDPMLDAEGVVRLLQTHGVQASATRLRSDGRAVSRVLLDYGRRVKAGLLVAGGYGHARWWEWAAGGTTRQLFFEATLPTFYAH